ncbi:polysaccharide biosynthesis/export family protein [Paraburkholderia edwinii]|uniref:Polysaccharide biosynthesis/export family protein n=1 Tax=Paraburkholderia edwinii TaxID=2861782 RepID=A0ABX8UXC9_9BURK|nr:polysaccharide biosynthesis/export family protein [Paraburkholderia edwinii]
MNQIGHTASLPASSPVHASLRRPRRASCVRRVLGLGGALSLLLALGACGVDPGQHFSSMNQDTYGKTVSGMPGAAHTTDAAAAGSDQPPPGALTEITPALIKAERLAAPTTVPADVQALFAAPAPYAIGPGDVLAIEIWDHPELNLPTTNVQTVGIDFTGSASVSTGYTVDTNGMIQFAYAGAVHVGGLTEMQARNVLAAQLGKYVRDPQVTLRVQSYRSKRVYMDGEVHSPGLQIFNDVPMTLTEAINRAGGFTAVGDRANIAVIRNGKSTIVDIPALVAKGINPSDVLLRNGDMVRVFAREDSKVFLMGEVTRPTTLFLRNGELSLNEALGDAGGVSQNTADAKQVYVVRNITADKHVIYHLDASNPSALALAENFELKAKDVVFVDTAAVVRWARVINNIVPSAEAAYFSKTAYGN